MFGELALLDGAPRSATASALTATEAVILPRDRFRELVATEPAVRDALLAVARRGAPPADDPRRGAPLPRHDRPARRPPRPARPRGRPDRRARTARSGCVATLTQAELASMVGCTRQSVNKLLGQFADDGLVRLDRDGIQVLDLDGLIAASRR